MRGLLERVFFSRIATLRITLIKILSYHDFENRFTNKNLMSKMFLNTDFASAREIIHKCLTLDSGKFSIFIQTFGPLISFSCNLVLIL